MIKNENVVEYWKDRYLKQGELTTGYKYHNKEENQSYYKEKKAFIKTVLPDDMGIVLDYGCGRDRKMKDLFSMYLGFDIIDDKPFLKPFFDTLFTSNVLQHNEDKTCLDVLKMAENAKYIILYEALTEDEPIERPHCISRHLKTYEKMVDLQTGKKLINFRAHKIHNNLHGVMVFK